MAGFWSGLSSTLRDLEALAADSGRLDEDVVDHLRALQYRLHWSSELLAGVEPPLGARDAHLELDDALIDARDATGEIASALGAGSGAVATMLLEWRGALFRVRLARMRLAPKPVLYREPVPEGFPLLAAIATLLTIAGVAAFALGALMAVWPLWAMGLALVAGGYLIYRP